MGVVYRAFDTVTRRPVALKTVRGAVDPSGIELFQREWTVLSRLCHPNIIDILDIGELTEEGVQKPYFVMPLLPGLTLDRLIKASGQRLTPERVTEIVCQACRGLQAAHDQKLVHRDIKPSNLFVMNDDSVKIIDFGVVHLADAASRTGIKGTLQYMAPEQFEMKPATPKSDIFSLGVVCYEALTGRKPFERDTVEDVTDAIRTFTPPPISDLNPAVNDQLSRAVHKAMAKAPYHRFSSAKEFAEVLQRAVRGEQIEVLNPLKIQPRITRVKRALSEGDYQFALDVLGELESEGNIDPEISLLRMRAQGGIREKSIRQLIESARTRFEEEEYPLALQKIQDVLALDPNNVDAAALKTEIEAKRSAAQIDRWHEIAQQHLQNKSFHKAREAVEEILKIDRSHQAARTLLAEIARAQQESARLRQERHELYDAALKAYRNGEISSALGKLERVMQLGKLAPGHPTTDAQYLALYDQIRSERDELHSRYTEARKLLDAQQFDSALAICKEVLNGRPGEPLFLSLKIEVEDRQRQDSSAKIAQIHSRAEAEADLERKFAVLKEAVQQFPNEQVFQHSLRLVKEKRDLVNSIVLRARHYESQGQFGDAVNQWEVLRNIYGQHPGLEFEVERLNRKQQEHIRDEQKAGWTTRIDRALSAGSFSQARELVDAALSETPEDAELLRLREQVEANCNRAEQAATLCEEGQQLAQRGSFEEALERLRAAHEIDAHNAAIRAQLGATLVQQARVLAPQNWEAAVPVLEEAMQVAPSDPNAASVSSLIEDVRRRKSVERYVIEARELQQKNCLPEALQKVRQGLGEFPGDAQLSRLEGALQVALSPQPEMKRAAAAAASAGAAPVARSSEPAQSNAKAAGADGATRFFVVRGGPAAESPKDEPARRRAEPAATEPVREVEPDAGWWIRSRTKVLIAAGGMLVMLLLAGVFLRRTPNHTASLPITEAPPPETSVTPVAVKASSTKPAVQTPPAPSIDKPAIAVPAPIRKVSVHFDTDPSGATITADDKDDLACSTPCDLSLSPGRHKVSASLDGHPNRERVLTVPAEKYAFIVFGDDLKPVHFSSEPAGMQLTIDGRARGETPLTLRLKQGDHAITATKGNLTYSQTVAVTNDDALQSVMIQGATSDVQQAPQ